MKALFILAIGLIFNFPAQAQQILPGTVHCIKGSVPHPVSYCADSTPCKKINGSDICLSGTSNPPAGAHIAPETCWSLVTEYTCLQYTSDCPTYTSDSACTEVGAKQCTTDASGNLMLSSFPKIGQCSSYTRSFSCIDPSKPSSSSTTMTTSCDTSTVMDGLDWTTTSPSAAQDFVLAATSQEFARQLAVYGSKDGGMMDGLFPGSSQGCRDGYLGLKNCCKSSGGGAVSNRTVAQKLMGGVAMEGFKKGGSYAIRTGTAYVADSVLSNAPEFMLDGLVPIINKGMNVGNTAGFGAWGFGTTADAAAGSFFASSSSVALGNSGLYFNPYALAAAVAIQFIMDALACTQAEVDLAKAKVDNLCHYIGNYCSTEVKVFGVVVGCLETTQSYCCYNGLLAKAVEEGAHIQLGISWGTPKNPACGGLNAAQLTSLDFTSPAMQEAMKPFQDQIMKNFNETVMPAINNSSIKNSTQGTAIASAQALCLQRQKLDPKTVCN